MHSGHFLKIRAEKEVVEKTQDYFPDTWGSMALKIFRLRHDGAWNLSLPTAFPT